MVHDVFIRRQVVVGSECSRAAVLEGVIKNPGSCAVSRLIVKKRPGGVRSTCCRAAFEKEPQQKQRKDAESTHAHTHRCWLETSLRGRRKPQSCRDRLTNGHAPQFHRVTVCPFEIVFAGELFNSLHKRASRRTVLTKPSGKAPVDGARPSDVQMMGCVMSRCRVCAVKSFHVHYCQMEERNELYFLGKIQWGALKATCSVKFKSH